VGADLLQELLEREDAGREVRLHVGVDHVDQHVRVEE
jgi:hypothetical protein